MPNLSDYLRLRFGIAVFMYYGDTSEHHAPHIHVRYQGRWSVFEIPNGRLLKDGGLPGQLARKVQAWIELNEEALMERWELAARNLVITKVD